MRLAIAWGLLVLSIFAALILQMFLPPMAFAHGARVLIVPVLFCYGALALPFWLTVPAAVVTGFFTDLMYLHIISEPIGGPLQVEIALGWSIVYFVFFGLLAHGFQPAFLRGHWWIHVLLSAAGTSLFLALQYAMICFRRQEFLFNEIAAWRILAPGLAAAVLSPAVYFTVRLAGQFLPDEGTGFQDYRVRR